jgi:outer membrane protein assembly factor BamA
MRPEGIGHPSQREQKSSAGHRRDVVARSFLFAVMVATLSGGRSYGQAPDQSVAPSPQQVQAGTDTGGTTPELNNYAGQLVTAVSFAGVDTGMLDPLPQRLPLQAGQKLDPQKVRESLRTLYATGLYQSIGVLAVPSADGIGVLFTGAKKLFVGRISIDGVNNDNLLAQLNGSTKLNPGTVYSEAKLLATDDLLKQALEDNGYYEGKISRTIDTDQKNSLVNVHYLIEPGTLARVGTITIDGDSSLTLNQFRRKAGLRHNSRVGRNTVSSALSSLQKVYQKKQRLAASITLESKTYDAQGQYVNYVFSVKQGPIVKVTVTGAKLGAGQIRKFVPIYEEGAVDVDLINEGAHNIRNYLQSKGYFDATVIPRPVTKSADEITLEYIAQRGIRHRVQAVSINGNKYFDTETIREHISVYAANVVERSGGYSQAMVASDVSNITSLYQGNGFSHVKVTPEIKNVEDKKNPKREGLLSIDYAIEEGEQQKIGSYQINGVETVPLSTLTPLLNTQVGQPYSSLNVVGDRDEILNYYLSHGYDKAQVNVFQQDDPKNAGLVDITVNVSEGQQFFVHDTLLSGIRHTRPSTVERQVTIRPDQPLDESALLTTQRKLYNLSLFNQVNTAIQNPAGEEIKKNVLLQLTEAKRWDVTYGFGFQAQTGTPSHNCPNAATLIALGINPATYVCSPNGSVGASPEVLFDISRTNLRGTQQSITLNTSYGSLEQIALVTYNNPELLRNPHFNFSLSGGYTSSQNVTTYAASVLGASVRVSERVDRPTTLLYTLSFRNVKVNPNSVQVSPTEIPLLSEPVRVAGPGFTWIRDTRDSPLDAHHGTFNTAASFFSTSKLGSQSNFGRLDYSNSTYYPYGAGWVFARQTRYAVERSFGKDSQELIPLPERLYAGGAQSLRGFSFNAAGPRDPTTGFPIGGAAAFVNTFELRTPSPHLPYVGNALGFVLFHDMGNVFDKSSDIWPSFARIDQPTPVACRDLSNANTTAGSDSAIGQQGGCSFNYFTHDVGVGFRYHTPIGPVRFDTSYLLNPPVYPVLLDYNTNSTVSLPAHVGIASNFNFFFSIGQMF